MSDEPKADTSRAARDQAIARQTINRRRRRVIRSTIGVVVIVIAMVVLSMLSRDQEAVRTCRERMEYAVERFQDLHDQDQAAPLSFPMPSSPDAEHARALQALRTHIHYNMLYTNRLIYTSGEVGVCCCSTPHGRLFRSAGRHVILYNVADGTYRVVWMDESAFAQRADGLGLRVLPQ
jgi:hypothetical protein